MKILQISNKVPYPEKDGGVIAINAITDGLLKAGCKVKLLAMNTKKHFIDIASIPEKFRNDSHLETVLMDTDIKPVKAFAALITGKSYNISRFYSEEFNEKLIEILKKEKFDVVHLEGLYITPYIGVIKQYSKAPIILRAHNIEWKIWQKLASEEKDTIKKLYLKKLSDQLRKYEERVMNDVDGIATISEQDNNSFEQSRCKVPIVTIPFGIDIGKYPMKESKHDETLFFIGALDWLPNLQGLNWFLKNVWDKVYAKFPGALFHIAGRNMPESLKQSKSPGVIFHGEVEDAKTFMQDYEIMVVPLLAGSGVRIKIIEGMAIGKPIISTSIGVDGIECNFGQDILVGDTPEQFANAIIKCLTDTELKNNLARNARKFVETNYDISKITEKLIKFYKELISKK